MPPSKEQNLLSQVDGGTPPVPVFDCHVFLSKPDARGVIHARAAALSDLTGSGNSERATLLDIVGKFKAIVRGCAESGQPIPWQTPPNVPTDDESERWIPVHL